MRIGLAVCAALLLDPYDFIDVTVSQPDPQTMKPVPMFHTDLPDDLLAPNSQMLRKRKTVLLLLSVISIKVNIVARSIEDRGALISLQQFGAYCL